MLRSFRYFIFFFLYMQSTSPLFFFKSQRAWSVATRVQESDRNFQKCAVRDAREESSFLSLSRALSHQQVCSHSGMEFITERRRSETWNPLRSPARCNICSIASAYRQETVRKDRIAREHGTASARAIKRSAIDRGIRRFRETARSR